MTELRQLQRVQHRKLLQARCFHRIVESRTFSAAYEAAEADEKLKAEKMLRDCDKDGLMEWIKEQLLSDLGTWSIRQLRERGRELSIPYSSRMDKFQLLSEIVQDEQRRCSDTAGQETSEIARADATALA